jgi:hypothetical protein
MYTAYTTASGQTPTDYLNAGSGELGGMTLAPGIYKFTTGVTISTDVTLSGSSSDVWIFQIPGTFDVASGGTPSGGAHVILTGGAQPSNIYWVVAGATTLGTYSTVNGNILDATNIALQTGATLNGRALAQTAVTLQQNTVTFPTPTVTPTPTAAPASGNGGDSGYNPGGGSSSSSGGSSGSSSGAGLIQPAGQLAPVQAPPALSVNNPAAAPAPGQLAPPQVPAGSATTTTTGAATGGLSLMGIAGIVALIAIIGVALLVFIRRNP